MLSRYLLIAGIAFSTTVSLWTLVYSVTTPSEATLGCTFLPDNTVSMFSSVSPRCPIAAGDRVTHVETPDGWRRVRTRDDLLAALPTDPTTIHVRLDKRGLDRTPEISVHAPPAKASRTGRLAVAFILTMSLLVLSARLTLRTPNSGVYPLTVLAWTVGTTLFPVVSGEQSTLLDVQWLIGTSFLWPALLHVSADLRGVRRLVSARFKPVSIAYVVAGVIGILRTQSALRGLSYFSVIDGLAFGLTAVSATTLCAQCVWALRSGVSPAVRDRAVQILLVLAAFFAPSIAISQSWPSSPKGNASIYEATVIVIAALFCGIGLWVTRKENGRLSVLAASFVFSCTLAGALCIPLIVGEITLGWEPYGGSVGLCWSFIWAVVMVSTQSLMPSGVTGASREVVWVESAALRLTRKLAELQDAESTVRLLCEGVRDGLGVTWVDVILCGRGVREGGATDVTVHGDTSILWAHLQRSLGPGQGPGLLDQRMHDAEWSEAFEDLSSAILIARIEWGGTLYGFLLLGPLSSGHQYRGFHLDSIASLCTTTALALHNAGISSRQKQAALEAARGSSALFLAHDIKGQLTKMDRDLADLAAAHFHEGFIAQLSIGLRRTTHDLVRKLHLFLSRRRDDRVLPLEDVIDGAVLLLSPETIVVRPGSDLPLLQRPHDVQRVLENLLRNAIEASSGEMKRRVSIYARKVEGATLVDVLDRGEGVPTEALERVFQDDYSTRGDGRGFGLAGARLLAEDMGACLTLTPREDGGTLAQLVLPDECDAVATTEIQ